MGRLSQQEREELTQLRKHIVERMHDLQDQTDNGEITDTTRYQQLEEEFGYDYLQTLAQINSLLHATKQETRITPKTLIASLLSIFLFGLAISTFFTFNPTAMLVAQQYEILDINQELQPGQSINLQLPNQTSITTLSLDQETTLTVEDASRSFVLYTNNRCVGCGQNIQEPYLLTNVGEEQTTISSVGVRT